MNREIAQCIHNEVRVAMEQHNAKNRTLEQEIRELRSSLKIALQQLVNLQKQMSSKSENFSGNQQPQNAMVLRAQEEKITTNVLAKLENSGVIGQMRDAYKYLYSQTQDGMELVNDYRREVSGLGGGGSLRAAAPGQFVFDKNYEYDVSAPRLLRQ